MSSGKPAANFPDAEAKLAKPVKQSAFERSKAEAEAKRKRDEAETAAVYAQFVKSFDHEEDDGASSRDSAPQRPRHGFGGPSGLNTGRRHFAMSTTRKSGPGSLGPPPSTFGMKRSFNDFARESRDRGSRSAAQESKGAGMSVSAAFNNESDDEDEVQRDAIERAELKAIAKAQLRLSNMPPGTSPAAIKALVPDTLTVDAVKIEQAIGSGTEKKCTNAIVTLSRDSPGGAMDAAVSLLQNRYLGYGYYLSAHRHLSSAVLNPVSASGASSAPAQPFGAKLIEQKPTEPKFGGPHGPHRGFAPPTSYNNNLNATSRADRFYVPVAPPDDVRLLQLIHMIAERVLEYGPEFEALLMSRPEVQRDERWAWLWDSKSVGGIWYRWRLWELTTGYRANPKHEPHVNLFEDAPPWQVPESLPFEFISELDEFVSDPDYDSSDDEEPEGDGNRGSNIAEVEKPFLSPIEKAKLVHLMARLPTNLSKLRKGDVARVTAFALNHADRGVSEVVDLIVSNIGKPFAFTSANPDLNTVTKEARQAAGTDETNEATDTSVGSLIGLYLVSDILSSSSATVLPRAWRFRGLFEKAFKDLQVFDFLGMMPEKYGWGRLKAEKWKRSISYILNLWEGWCVFPGKTQELFASTFEKPPSLKVEEGQSETSLDKGKWKSMAAKPTVADEVSSFEAPDQVVRDAALDDVVGEPIEDDDVEGEPILDDDVEGEPILDDDVEGEPILDDDVQGEPIGDDDIDSGHTGAKESKKAPSETEEKVAEPTRHTGEAGQGRADTSSEQSQPSRKRMRAVDMFADSDDSERGSK
ncbi:hypothetical protein HIM_07419 [Hirsutella minnesotensis 3608]|uniref:CID domain-containing protein n=1 Tax=Hirsutella minnesotensis 3608 TaxID=1043627 RepID=A0A0F7ZYX3_9HYPO|nr:hypothetical protein HIM_07419 [Hirsutella minnesotensis 3608]